MTISKPKILPVISDTSSRLDVLAALMRNSTSQSAAWRTWDNDTAATPVENSIIERPISEKKI